MSILAAVSKARETLEQGEVLIKFHDREQKAAKRFFFLSSGMLYWCKVGQREASAKHSCSLASVSRVSTRKAFCDIYANNGYAAKAAEETILTLHFDKFNKAIALQAPNVTLRDAWKRAVLALSTAKEVREDGGTSSRTPSVLHQQTLEYEDLDAEGEEQDEMAEMEADRAMLHANGGYEYEQKYNDDELMSPPQRVLAPPSESMDVARSSAPPPAPSNGMNGRYHASELDGYDSAGSVVEAHEQPQYEQHQHQHEMKMQQQQYHDHEYGQYENETVEQAAPEEEEPPPPPPSKAAAPNHDPSPRPPRSSRKHRRNRSSMGSGRWSAPPPAPPSHCSSSSLRAPCPLDRCILPDPIPPDMKSMIDIALASIMSGARARIRQKTEDYEILKELEDHNEEQARWIEHLEATLEDAGIPIDGSVEAGGSAERIAQLTEEVKELEKIIQEQDEEWAQFSHVTQTKQPGVIEIRLATPNLVHDPPHQWVAVVYVQNPLEEQFTYAQTISLMPSSDGGVSYAPKITLSPTQLFAFRQSEDEATSDEVDEAGNPISSSGGELVGAQIKVEIWDLVNKRMYGKADSARSPRSPRDGDGVGYQGHVEFNMTELVAAKHHVMSMPILNSINEEKQKQWEEQKVKIVAHYALPAPDPVDGDASAQPSSSAASTEQAMRLAELEEEIRALREERDEQAETIASMRSAMSGVDDERRVRGIIEKRLADEQKLRAKAEADVMRLKPRALELIDTTEELELTKKRIAELELTVGTLQEELRQHTVPQDVPSMLDELVDMENPSTLDLQRIRKFILDQERIRSMLMGEMNASRRAHLGHETTHDELIRRESALQTHIASLEEERRKLATQNSLLLNALNELQLQTRALSERCESAESAHEHTQVSVVYLTEQEKVLRKQIAELERALLVHHEQMKGFEVANIPAPQQQQVRVLEALCVDEELEAAARKARIVSEELARQKKAEEDAAAAAEAAAAAAAEAHAQAVAEAEASGEVPPPPPPEVEEPPRPRRATKIVYSDQLEEALAMAAKNTRWQKSVRKK